MLCDLIVTARLFDPKSIGGEDLTGRHSLIQGVFSAGTTGGIPGRKALSNEWWPGSEEQAMAADDKAVRALMGQGIY